jgi:hypothetical protein
MAAATALPRTLLPTDLCSFYAGLVGIPVFLLVPICVGDRSVSAVGDRLSEAENLSVDGWQGGIDAALPPSREDVTHRQHTGRVTLREVCAAGFRTRLSLEK